MYKPPGSFDALIKQMLDNVQRGADATAQRFTMEREERLIGEQEARTDARTQQARTQQLDDYARMRIDQQTDEARAYRLQMANEFFGLLPYMDEGDENVAVINALVESLGTPSSAVGEAAWREATNMNVTLPDGSVAPLALYKAELERQRAGKQINDAAVTQLLSSAIEYVSDTSRSAASRVLRANGILSLKYLSDDLKDAMLASAGVEDPDARREIRNAGRITEQQIRANEVNIAAAKHDLMVARYDFQEYVAGRDYRDQVAAAAAYKAGRDNNLTDMQMFLEAGILPTDEKALQTLAQMRGMTVEALRATGETIFGRLMRQRDAQTVLLERDVVAAGQTIDMNRLTLNLKQHELDQALMWDDLRNHKDMATWVAEAALRGDVEALEALQNLVDVYPQQLGNVNWATVMEQATAVRGDANDVREHNAKLREYAVTTAAVASAGSVDAYVDKYAPLLAPLVLDSQYDPATGTYPELEAAISDWLGGMTQRDIADLGGEAFLRDKLRSAVMVGKVNSEYQEAAGALQSLIGTPPNPSDVAAVQGWTSAILRRAAELGLDVSEWATLAKNTLAGHEVDRNKALADMRLANQQADYYFNMSFGQWVDNTTAMWKLEALQSGGVEQIDPEALAKQVNMFKQAHDASMAMVNSDYCKLPAADASMGKDSHGRAFVQDIPECQQAADSALYNLNMMNLFTSSLTGGPGALTVDPVNPTGAPGSAPGGGGAASSSALIDYMTQMPDGNADGFDAAVYDSLPGNVQAVVESAIRGGHMRGEELRAFMNEAVNQQAVIARPLVPPANAPALADSGLPVTSPEWWSAPVEERLPQLEGTLEWQSVAAAVGNLGYGWDELLDLELNKPGAYGPMAQLQAAYPNLASPADLAEMFGFMRAKAPTPQPREEQFGSSRGATPPASGGRGSSVAPEPPVFSAQGPGLKGIVEEAADFARLQWEAAQRVGGAVGGVVGNIASRLWDPSQPAPHQVQSPFGGAQKPTDGYEPDIEGFVDAISVTTDSLIDSARRLYMLDQRGGRVWESVNTPPAEAPAEAPAAGRSTVFGRQPTPATAEGPGDPGSYITPSAAPGVTPTLADVGGEGKAVPASDLLTTPAGFEAIREHEKFSAKAYWDVNGWAVGYGQHAEGINQDTVVTLEEAEALLANHVAGVEATIKSALPGVPLTPLQFDALVSLTYNIGNGRFAQSDMARKLREGDYLGAAAEFDRYNTAGGEVLAALTARRAAEKEMFLRGTLPSVNLTAPAQAGTPAPKPIPIPNITAGVPSPRGVTVAPTATIKDGPGMVTGGRF